MPVFERNTVFRFRPVLLTSTCCPYQYRETIKKTRLLYGAPLNIDFILLHSLCRRYTIICEKIYFLTITVHDIQSIHKGPIFTFDVTEPQKRDKHIHKSLPLEL